MVYRPDLDNSPPSPASNPSRMKKRAIQQDESHQADHSQVVLTVGEIPFLVSMIPCTIHGCRPLSVRNQPAVFNRNGSTRAPDRYPQEHPGRREFLV